jgi:deoxyribodipyrimidine photolyase-like uncharacterized protein
MKHKNKNHKTTNVRSLWRAVIMQAVVDATNKSRSKRALCHRTQAKKWLKNFIKYKLNNFGNYEDGIHSNIIIGYHSCISPILNIGLLTPKDVIDEIKKTGLPYFIVKGFDDSRLNEAIKIVRSI